MFRTDIVMPHTAGFFDGIFQHLLGASGKLDLDDFRLTDAAQALYHLLNPFWFQT